MSNRDLQSTDPRTAVELYISHRETEVADATLENIRLHLGHFREWCEQEGSDDTTDLTGRDLHEFRLWRQEGIAQTTLSINLSSVRTFLQWAETIGASRSDTH